MENNHNIEELVADKDFDQLSDAEKELIIKEMGSAEAYTEMRNVILAIQDEDEIEAPANMRSNIMDAYEKHHQQSDKKVIPLWLSGKKVYKQPLVYLLIAASVLFAVFIFLPDVNTNVKPQLAENKTKKEIKSSETPVTDNDSNSETSAPKKAEQENSPPSQPSSIKKIIIDHEVDEIDLNEEEIELAESELKDAPEISLDDNEPSAAPEILEKRNSFSKMESEIQSDMDEEVMIAAESLDQTSDEGARNQKTFQNLSLENVRSSEAKPSALTLSFNVQEIEADHYTAY